MSLDLLQRRKEEIEEHLEWQLDLIRDLRKDRDLAVDSFELARYERRIAQIQKHVHENERELEIIKQTLEQQRNNSSNAFGESNGKHEYMALSNSDDPQTLAVWQIEPSLEGLSAREMLERLAGISSPDLPPEAELTETPVIPPPEIPPPPVVERAPIGTKLLTFHGHSSSIHAVGWSPDQQHIASGSDHGTIKIWEAASGENVQSYHKHESRVTALAWSPACVGDEVYIASGSVNGLIWRPTNGQKRAFCRLGPHPVTSLAWSPDGQRLAIARKGGTVQVWDMLTENTLFIYRGHLVGPFALAWSPSGDRIASTGGDQDKVQVWDAATGKNLATYREHATAVTSVTWSPDGHYIASASSTFKSGQVRIWNVPSGKTECSLTHTALITALAWSPTEPRIASASNDGTIQLWDTTTGHHIFTYCLHTDAVNALAWSPDGQLIASASNDKTVQIWQAI